MYLSLSQLKQKTLGANVCEDVLDDSVSVEACIGKYCSSLAYDEKFRAYL